MSGRLQHLHDLRVRAARPIGLLRAQRRSFSDRAWDALTAPGRPASWLSRPERLFLALILAPLAIFLFYAVPALLDLHRDLAAAIRGGF